MEYILPPDLRSQIRQEAITIGQEKGGCTREIGDRLTQRPRNSGSLTTLAAIRRASSFVSSLAAGCFLRCLLLGVTVAACCGGRATIRKE